MSTHFATDISMGAYVSELVGAGTDQAELELKRDTETDESNFWPEGSADSSDPFLISIGDVAKILGVPTHTIRYWEKEFPEFLIPGRTQGKQRRYGNDEIVKLRKVFSMLRDEGYSIAGARRILAHQNQKSDFLKSPSSSLDSGTAERLLMLLKNHLEQSLFTVKEN